MKIIPMPNSVELTGGKASFELDKLPLTKIKSDEFSDSEYRLTITDNGVKIEALDEKGFFYAEKSLLHLICEAKVNNTVTFDKLVINDKPRFHYRGFMLDSARHFFSVAEVKKLLDACAALKINYFHWHLVDDQGFRFESKMFPLLTEIGSKRKETKGDNTPVEGFYTQDEMKDIVDYAKKRFIEVIPEIDIPGHATAMIAAYPYLSCLNKKIPVETTFGIKTNLLCAGNPAVYDFLKQLLEEVIDIFPCEYIHLGGDEAVKIQWKECPACQKLLKEEGLQDFEQLQAFFTDKIVDFLAEKGKTTIVWNEAVNSGRLNQNAIMQYWSDGNPPTRVINAINNKRETIISKFNPMYLDYPHGMHSLKMLYNFEPVLEGVAKENISFIKGVESPVWTEYITTNQRLELQTFPRLVALSEIGWTNSENKNYNDFKLRLENTKKILDDLNILYTQKHSPNKLVGFFQILSFAIKKIGFGTIKEAVKIQRELEKSRDEG